MGETQYRWWQLFSYLATQCVTVFNTVTQMWGMSRCKARSLNLVHTLPSSSHRPAGILSPGWVWEIGWNASHVKCCCDAHLTKWVKVTPEYSRGGDLNSEAWTREHLPLSCLLCIWKCWATAFGSTVIFESRRYRQWYEVAFSGEASSQSFLPGLKSSLEWEMRRRGGGGSCWPSQIEGACLVNQNQNRKTCQLPLDLWTGRVQLHQSACTTFSLSSAPAKSWPLLTPGFKVVAT